MALNDTIMVFAFAPIVALLLGLSAITVPWDTLLTSVVLYIVDPGGHRAALAQGAAARAGRRAFDAALAQDRPVVDRGAAATLVLLFAFQGEAILRAAAGHRDAGGADPDPGLLQFGARLLAEPPARASRTASPARRR